MSAVSCAIMCLFLHTYKKLWLDAWWLTNLNNHNLDCPLVAGIYPTYFLHYEHTGSTGRMFLLAGRKRKKWENRIFYIYLYSGIPISQWPGAPPAPTSCPPTPRTSPGRAAPPSLLSGDSGGGWAIYGRMFWRLTYLFMCDHVDLTIVVVLHYAMFLHLLITRPIHNQWRAAKTIQR